ncbi:MAG: hypothetical protein ACJ739_05130 [Acidimicrobiales bacterium]
MDDRAGRDPWDDAVGDAEHLLGGDAPRLAARLEAWLADARVERSADERAREHWLRAAADADATFSGVLVDLAERGVPLAVATAAGHRHRGVVEVVGADFVGLRVASRREVLVALRAISSVRTAPSAGVTSGERAVTTHLRLGDVLGELAAERARVTLFVFHPGEAVSGELRSVGQDVVTVRTGGEAPGAAYLRVDGIAEVALG